MKETGVIRRIDELGRIVVPKEIRRSLGIKDGEDLEIFVDQNGIYLKKHSRIMNYQEMIEQLRDVTEEEMHLNLCMIDREKVLVSSNGELLNHVNSYQLNKLLEDREVYESSMKEKLFEDVDFYGYFYIVPIIVSASSIGAIILINEDPLMSYMKSFVHFLVKLIVKKVDIL